jgi:hypothetical protein
LTVEFSWREDRFVHEFVLPDGSRIASIEGDAAESWPPSPPLQQLSLERIDGCEVILGVGAAGIGHWSISVESTVIPEQRHAFKFDLACRCKTECDWLGSSYLGTELLAFVPTAGARLTHDGDRLALEPDESSADPTSRWAYWVSSAAKSK